MKNKWIKITIIILLILFVSIGSVILINKRLAQNQVVQQKDYFIATATGNTDYHYPLPFEKGTTASEVAHAFTSHFNSLQRKQGTRLISIESSQQIYSDIQIKIT